MSELRAPDPTLDSLSEDVIVTWWDGDRAPATAHRFSDSPDMEVETVCGHKTTASPIGAEDARWFTVPCRSCFPDASPLGTDPLNRPNAGRYLAWQHG